MSDHGEAFGVHTFGGERQFFHGMTLYNEVLHVPLLFRVPGAQAARGRRRRRADRLVADGRRAVRRRPRPRAGTAAASSPRSRAQPLAPQARVRRDAAVEVVAARRASR